MTELEAAPRDEHQWAFDFIVPTRDSNRWIGPVLEAYRNLGIEPLFLLDSRSQDGTGETLMRMGARLAVVTPTFDRVEAMLAFVPALTSKQWVVRLDDDEFPSRALIAWLDVALQNVDVASVALSRRDCLLHDGALRYTQYAGFYFDPEKPDYLNPQWRLFRPRDVNFISDIHTPGFERTHSVHAPEEAFFIHLDWVVRDHAERLNKLERYEAQQPGAGRHFRQFYLPEMHSLEALRLADVETTEFDGLVCALNGHAPAIGSHPIVDGVDPATPSIVSYAPHDADVRLARCFSGVVSGFYIDVGAGHPMAGSMTWGLYKAGWNGINIAPTSDVAALLNRYRIRDITLIAPAGARAAEGTCDPTGTSSASLDTRANGEDGAAPGARPDLATICTMHAPGTIHVLRVKTDGHEAEWLAGHDWGRWRPWLIVVERPEPVASATSDTVYRSILAEARYRFAASDGLHEFFVGADRAELAGLLAEPVRAPECVGPMSEQVRADVRRNGSLATWFDAYRKAALREALAQEPTADVAAYLRALGWTSDVCPDDDMIARAYLLILGRPADPVGLKMWSHTIVAEHMSAGTFLSHLCKSEEFLTLRLTADVYLASS